MKDINRKKLILRTIIATITFGLALLNIELLKSVFYLQIYYFKGYQICWFLLIANMILVCIPKFNGNISNGKIFKKYFKENPIVYNKKAVKIYTKESDKKAKKVGLIWAFLIAIIGLLLFKNIINTVTINLIVVFFYFSDQFCINIWCPFRVWIIKNRCCNSCRIYNWGHFMIFSPYIFISSFWTYSLVIMSLFVLLQWEYMHYKYPDRFCEISNLNLQCSHCLKAKCSYSKSLNKADHLKKKG